MRSPGYFLIRLKCVGSFSSSSHAALVEGTSVQASADLELAELNDHHNRRSHELQDKQDLTEADYRRIVPICLSYSLKFHTVGQCNEDLRAYGNHASDVGAQRHHQIYRARYILTWVLHMLDQLLICFFRTALQANETHTTHENRVVFFRWWRRWW